MYRAASLFSTTQIRYMKGSAMRMLKNGGTNAWDSHLDFGEISYRAKAKQYAVAASRLATHEVDRIVEAASI